MSRLKKVLNEREFEKNIDEYITQGYKVKSKGQNNALLEKTAKKSAGIHVLIALTIGLWTFFIANIIYQVIPGRVEDSVLLKIDEV